MDAPSTNGARGSNRPTMRRRRQYSHVALLALYVAAVFLAPRVPPSAAIEPVPQASDILTVVNRDSQKDVRLNANLYIPDGGELLLTIDVPRESILVDASAPAKVTRVYSSHVDGTFGVGESIDVFVEFTSAVDVTGAPTLLLATGCHSSACHVREIQRLRCQGTVGKFAVAFAGQEVVNIPWDATAKQFAIYLQRMTKIDRVLVDYLQQDKRACTFFGNNITVTFESMNIDGADGDLPEMTADAANTNGDGTILGHVRLDATLSATAWEMQKGRRVLDRAAIYVGKQDPRTLQFTYTVMDGDNATRLEYANTDALTRSVLNSGGTILVRNADTLVAADTTLPPPAFAGDWERGIGSSLSVNAAIRIDVRKPIVTGVTSPHVDGTFGIGQAIPVHVYFSVPVVVAGLPTIVLETGQVDRIIPFSRVTGTNENIVEFLYIVQTKDTTPDLTYTGISALVLNGGSIKRKSTTPTTDAVLTLPVNGEKGSLSWSKNIVIDTSNPKVTGVFALTADGTYTGGDTIQIQVGFNTPVVVTGAPQLMLSTGRVDLFPGSFVIAAPVSPTNSNTIVFPPVDHGLSTTESEGLQFLIGGQVYTVSTVIGDAVSMVENYIGTVVNPKLIGGPSIAIQSPGYRPASYASGSGTNNLIFVYTIQRGDSSLDLGYTSTSALELNGGTIKRLSTSPFSDASITLATPGTRGSLSFAANIEVNTAPPRVLQVSPITRDGVYRAGDKLFMSVLFDLPVVVLSAASVQTTASSTEDRVAVYYAGSGSTTLVFQFECAAGDQADVLDVLDSQALRPAYGSISGYIRRKASSPLVPAVLDLPATGLTSKAIAIDQSCAFILTVSTTHEDATVGAGEVVDVTVAYSVAVNVDVTAGVPEFQLSTQKKATYQSGSGSAALTYRYVVQQDDPPGRLNYLDTFSIQLNGAVITDVAAGKLATSVLPDQTTALLAVQHRLFIDTSAPIVVDVSTRLLDGSYTVGDLVIITVALSFPVVVSPAATNRGVPTLYLQIGGSDNFLAPASLVSANDEHLYFAMTIAQGHSTSNLAYPARTSLRCVGNYGINKDGAQGNAVTPHGVEFQGRLLILWSEKSPGGSSQIRARSLEISKPFTSSWIQEDGDGATSRIQFDATMDATSPMVVVFSTTKVYACWQEKSSATGNPTQIRVALYLGGDVTVLQRWRLVGRSPPTSSGLNRDATQNAASPHIAVHNSKLYAAWHEANAAGVTQIRVAVFNGQDLTPAWAFVDGNSALRGLNFASARAAQSVRLLSCRSTLYATWEEVNAAGNAQIRVASLGGTDAVPRWAFVDGSSASLGLNYDSTMNARQPSPTCLGGTTMVVAWHVAVPTASGGTRTLLRAKQLALAPTAAGAAATWQSADGNRGLNFDVTQSAVNVRLRAHPLSATTLYATWEEVDAGSGKSQVRVAVFTGGASGSWAIIDGGAKLSNVNDAPSQHARSPVLVASTTMAATWYAVWQEMHATAQTTHIRTSIYTGDVGGSSVWQSLHDRCVLRRSTTPTTPSNLLLPELNTLGSLDFGRQIRIDTAAPTILDVSFASCSRVMATMSTVQTVDIFNRASLTQGQYQLVYDNEATTCIDWNAPNTAVKAALEGIATMNLQVGVSVDATSFQDAARYTITFAFPTSGLKPLKVISSSTCAAWTCLAASPRLACNFGSLVQLNANRNVPMGGGVVDGFVQFSTPVIVPSGGAAVIPKLTLETGTTDTAAAYTPRGLLREFDVGMESASMMLAGAFRLSYGDSTAANAMENTDCVDASFLSNADAEYELLTKLNAIKSVRTIGIQSVTRRRQRNGYRYAVQFSNSSSGDLLDLVPADASACEGYAGRTQTIDVQADTTILQGEFKVSYEDETTACISAILRAKGLTASMEDLLSQMVPSRVIPLQVVKDTSIFGTSGLRYYISFLSLSDAVHPIRVSTTGCAVFLCDDGNGGSVACTGVKVTANADYKAAPAVTNTLAFQYVIQNTDTSSALAVRDPTALVGSILRYSMAPVLPALLAVPSTLLSPSRIRILSSDEIPRVDQVYSSTANGVYSAGDVIVIYVVFSDRVDVIGKPMLELNSGGVAFYHAGSGTLSLEFRYKILPGQSAADLNYASTLSLRTPGRFVNICVAGSGASQSLRVDADLTLPVVTSSLSLGSQSALVVQTTPPSIVSVSSTRVNTRAGGTGYGVGDIIDIGVLFSGEIAVAGTPTITLNSGGTAVFSYSGYRQLLDIGVHAMYPVTSGQFAVSYKGVASACIDYNDANSNAVTSLKSQLLAFSDLATIGIVSVTMSTKKNGHRFTIIFDSTNVLEVPDSVIPVVSDVCAPLLPSSSDSAPDRLLERSTDSLVVFQYVVQENNAASVLDYSSAAIDLTGVGAAMLARSRTPTVNALAALPGVTSLNRLGALKSLAVDGSPVIITHIISDSAAGTYGVAFPPVASPSSVYPGEIYFRVIFSRAVKVVGSPTMELATGSLQPNGVFTPNRFATFVGQPQPDQAAFLYHILEGDQNANLAFTSLDVLANAQVYCVSTSSQTMARTAPLPRLLVSTTSVLKIDATSVPTTVKLSSSHPNGRFGAGEAIKIDVTFSKLVTYQSGLNRNHDSIARNPATIEFKNNIFVLWTEWSSFTYKSTATKSFLYMRVFASDTLAQVTLSAPVAAAINRLPNTFIEKVAVTVWLAELYAAWDENGQIFCSRFNGLAVPSEPWTVIPNMGANRNPSRRASDVQLLVHNLKLMMVWREDAVVNNAGKIAGQIRVAQRSDDFDAPLWIFHDGNQLLAGLNKNPLNDAIQPSAAVYRGAMFVAWSEYSDDVEAYQVVVARRYVQTRDSSVWQFLDASQPSSDFYISSYRPRLAVRKKGIEDTNLLLSWYRDTLVANVSEVVHAEVLETYWSESANNIPRQLSPSLQTLPNAKSLDILACADSIFASWIEESSSLPTSRVQTLRLASLGADKPIAAAWAPVFATPTAVANHNTSYDVSDVALVCSMAAVPSGTMGVFWTEFNGITTELRLRHSVIPQRLETEKNTTWGETSSGAPLLQMDTASVPTGYAVAIDRSGLHSNVLQFLYVVQPGQSSLDLDVLNQQAFFLNEAQVQDYFGQVPHFTLFPKSRDPRSLSFNNDLVIDTTAPVVTSVTSTTPSGEYGIGETIFVQIKFSVPVAVNGDAPMLYLRSDELHLTNYTVNPAAYVSGSGTDTLLFVFTSGELDYCNKLDYFRVDSLVLPRKTTIKRNATFPVTDASLALPVPGSPQSLSGTRRIAIKPTRPVVTSMTSSAQDGTYYPGDIIPIVVTFSLPVVLYGWPVLLLDTGNAERPSYAGYSSGNGTVALTFLYAVTEGDAASDLEALDDRNGNTINYVNSLKLVGQSTVKRLSTTPVTNAIVTLPAPGWPGSLSSLKAIVIDTARPKIVDVRSPTPDGTYDIGDMIEILVEFSKVVVVQDAVPYVQLSIAPRSQSQLFRTAVYQGGSTTKVLRFMYTVAAEDSTGSTPLDTFDEKSFLLRPILFGSAMLQKPAKVLCQSSHPTQPANLTMPRPGPILRADAVRSLVGNNQKIFLRTDGLRVTSMEADVASGGTYAPGQRILLSVIFSSVTVVQGSPRLKLNANALLPVYASYLDGSGTNRLRFQYIVTAGDAVPVLEAASRRALELPAGSVITDINGGYVPLRLGAPLLPGSLSFNYKIAITSTPPTVIRVFINNANATNDGSFGVGDDIAIAVQFSLRVAIPVGATPPSLLLQFIGGARAATYVSGDQTTTLLFTTRVTAADSAAVLEYASVGALSVSPAPSGMYAAATKPTLVANPALPSLGSSGSLSASNIRVSNSPPTVVSVRAVDRNGVYGLGDRLRIRVRFSYRVVVVASASCGLELFLGGAKTSIATFLGGSTTTTLAFEYRVVAGDRAGRLAYRSTASLVCSILQLSANPSLVADTTLPAPGADGSLSFSSRIQVNAAAPRIVSVTSPLANAIYGAGQDVDITVAFSEAVQMSDVLRCNAKLRLAVANARVLPRTPSVAAYVAGSRSSMFTFRYTVRAGDMAFPIAYDGVDALYMAAPDCAIVAITVDRRGASLRLPVPGGSGSLSNNRDIRVDAVEPPRVLSVGSSTPNGIYTAGDTVTVAITFTASVVVGGLPYLRLDVGTAVAAQAFYTSGSGTATLTFAYAVQPGDHSDRLEYERCPSDARVRPTRREFTKLVKCLPEWNALQLGIGGSIQRAATSPRMDAVLDLPEVDLWPKLRVATSRQEFVYVDQLDDITDLPADEQAQVVRGAYAQTLANEVSISQQKSSIYFYSNGIPSHATALPRVEQRYFIELVRFPVVQPNPLVLTGFDGFTGVMLNGIPFKPKPAAPALPLVVDACGGAVDAQMRYYYADLPTCFIDSLVSPVGQPSADAPQSPPLLLLGYAFDGVPVYYFYDEAGQEARQLDECNGMRGADGGYRYHLVASPGAPFMPCLRAINDPPSTARGTTANLIRVFRSPVNISHVDGLSLPSLSRFDGLVVDENPATAVGTAIWLNPEGVSVVYSATTVIVRSDGIPDGQYGPFPNAYNPYAVREQDYVFQLPRQPTVAATPTVLPTDTPIGVMLNGIPFFNNQSPRLGGNVMDPKSKAYWKMDKCHGLVDGGGNYRYYGTPDCLLADLGGQLVPGQPSPLIGYALDGFPLYGPYTESGVVPTDLDACNGRVGDDGSYRYHATPGTAPYLIGCFKGTPLFATNDLALRSLSYANAIRVDTQIPHVTQIFTNKSPGQYVLGETLDIVVVWSCAVIVLDTQLGLPSVDIPGSQQPQQAIFSAAKSSPTQSVFVYTVTAAETTALEYNYDFRSIIKANGATILRASAVPTMAADLQLIWAECNPRFASKHQIIKDVRVVLRGLYHPYASDLSVRVFHGTRSATVFDRCCLSMAFGLPDKKLRVNEEQIGVYPDNPTSGVGMDYGFQDFLTTRNFARDGGATAMQSSTSGKCVPSNAVDGSVHGTVTSQNVARSQGTNATVAWWELRLIKPMEIGTIRVWLPQRPERRPAIVQVVRVNSNDGVTQVYGSFTLVFTSWDGQVYTTPPINWNAVAMKRDEDARIANLGIGKDESVETKILAAIPATETTNQRLYVARTPAAAALSSNGAFSWSITFLADTYLYEDGALPLAVGDNSICDGTGVVTLARPFPGDDYDEWAYVSRDDDGRPFTKATGHTSMFPFWILVFADTSVMNFESLQDAIDASTWSVRVGEHLNATQLVSVNPSVGLQNTQFVRIVAENPYAFLTLAEVEVFQERNHLLSQYPSGTPISTEYYPGAETWSPEESFQERFGQLTSEGRWTLSIRDMVRRQQPRKERDPIHGAGAVSDWVLYVTDVAGKTRAYYMDIKALVKTLPRHGKLFVAVNETDTEYLDRDRNGVLDLVEAERYLASYYLSFDVLPVATRSRVLWNFLDGYAQHGGIEILADPSERQKIYPVATCDRQCLVDLGFDPYYWPGTTGDRALKPMEIRRDRIIRYIPNAGFTGLDTLTFAIAIGSQESAVRGTIEFHVTTCHDKKCEMNQKLLDRHQFHV